MYITLIRPPSYSAGLMGAQRVPYLGVAYIAASARAAGHAVNIIDMCGEDIDRTEIIHTKYVAHGMPFSALKERMEPSKVIGITCMFSQEWVFNGELSFNVFDLPHPARQNHSHACKQRMPLQMHILLQYEYVGKSLVRKNP